MDSSSNEFHRLAAENLQEKRDLASKTLDFASRYGKIFFYVFLVVILVAFLAFSIQFEANLGYSDVTAKNATNILQEIQLLKKENNDLRRDFDLISNETNEEFLILKSILNSGTISKLKVQAKHYCFF